MMDLVSVMVTVYNVENYVGKCIESIMAQTYTNLEIILVDDGSNDDSGKICDEYAKMDNRIHVIHKPNGGNGDARNSGLAYATGEWVLSVDSDDIIHKRQIEILLTIAKDKKADIVVGGYKSFVNDIEVEDKYIDENYIDKAEVLTESHLYDDGFIEKRSMILTVPWGKLIRKKIHEGVTYPKIKRNLDTWTTWRLYENADGGVVYLDEPLYYWRENPNSITRKNFSKDYFNAIEAYIEQLEYYHKAGKQRYVEIIFAEYTQEIFWLYNRMKERNLETSSLEHYRQYMKNHLGYVKLTKSLGLKQWIRYRYLAYYKIPKLLMV